MLIINHAHRSRSCPRLCPEHRRERDETVQANVVMRSSREQSDRGVTAFKRCERRASSRRIFGVCAMSALLSVTEATRAQATIKSVPMQAKGAASKAPQPLSDAGSNSKIDSRARSNAPPERSRVELDGNAGARAFEISIPYEKYQLANGLEVIFHHDASLPRVAVSVWYHVGPVNEPPKRSGFAHRSST